MKLRIPDSFRVRLGRKYIEWAEMLPKRNGNGVISTLQFLRERHREEAERVNKESRTPQGAELKYLYFRLIELYQVEDFEQLWEGLKTLLPGIECEYSNRGRIVDFERLAGSIFEGSRWPFGSVVREKKKQATPFNLRPTGELTELPAEVKRIDIELHKVLPSTIVVSMDVHLSDEATQELGRLQNVHYFPTIRFKKLFPWGILAGGFSEEPSDLVMRREIVSWLDNLRRKVEECIRPFLSGYFMNRHSHIVNRLPAIEVYSLKGVPEEDESFIKWKNESRNWWDSLGFNFFNSFKNKEFIYDWPRDEGTFSRSAHRLVILKDQFLKSERANRFGDEEVAVKYYTKNVLDAVRQSISVLQFLSATRKSVEKLRQKAFGNIKFGLLSRNRMSRYINIDDAIQRECLLLDRVSMEFEEAKAWISGDLKEVEGLFKKGPNGKDVGKGLKEAMLDSIEFSAEKLKNYLSLIKASFSEHLSLRNMDAMYRLQRRIFWLTTIMVFTAFAMLVANWSNMQSLLYHVFSFFN